jgi:DNA-directed RNA polymerase specialized sigma24 family protein
VSRVPQLWTKHRNIAVAVAAEWRIPGMDPDDVRQEALIALWESGRAHDKEKGPFPPFARLVINRRLRDRLQAATRQKRTCDLDYDTEPVGPDLESTVIEREQLALLLDDPRIAVRRRWRDNKRRQRAA